MLFRLCLIVVIVYYTCYTDAAWDDMEYDIDAQAKCKEVTRGPTGDCRWKAGLNMLVDQVALGGRIIAYKIRWANEAWSHWYVPGINDIDTKINPYARECSMPYKSNSMRRVWSTFYDHTHKFIVCQP